MSEIDRVTALINAGNKLSFCAQTIGGTAGRDDDLVRAIDGWTVARDAALAPTADPWSAPGGAVGAEIVPPYDDALAPTADRGKVGVLAEARQIVCEEWQAFARVKGVSAEAMIAVILNRIDALSALQPSPATADGESNAPELAYQRAEELLCTCGAGHGSLEGHIAECAWQSSQWKKWGEAFDAYPEMSEAFSHAYYLITGKSPQWGPAFGIKDALRDIDDAQRLLRVALAAAAPPVPETADWQPTAFGATVAMAIERGMVGAGDLSLEHLKDMLHRLTPNMSRGKLGRWLGWAQAAVVASGCATLDEMKELNQRVSEAFRAAALNTPRATS